MGQLTVAGINTRPIRKLAQYVWEERIRWLIPLVITLWAVDMMLIVARSAPINLFTNTAF